MDDEKRKLLIKLHSELLGLSQEIVSLAYGGNCVENPDYDVVVVAVYNKLFDSELHRVNMHMQKEMVGKIPDVNKLLAKIMGTGE